VQWYEKTSTGRCDNTLVGKHADVPATRDAYHVIKTPPCLQVVGWKTFPYKSIHRVFATDLCTYRFDCLCWTGDHEETECADYITGKPMRKYSAALLLTIFTAYCCAKPGMEKVWFFIVFFVFCYINKTKKSRLFGLLWFFFN